MKFIICSCLMTLCMAEAPRGGPYPPSGYKPQGARLHLPNEQPQVEVSQQRVEYAGQLGEISETTTFASTDYPPTHDEEPRYNIPESNDDDLRVQSLPKPNTPDVDFKSGLPVPRGQYRNEGVHFIRPSELQQLKQQRAYENQKEQQLRVLPKPYDFRAEQEQSYQQFNNQPQPSRFAARYNPKDDQVQVNIPVIPMRYIPVNSEPVVNIPARQYGQPGFARTPNAYIPPQRNDQEDSYQDDEESSGQPGIAVANAFNGQYYVFGPKNVLHRVEYEGGQTPEDKNNNGYTAQLRYSPVEPIRDPIYAHDARGQLIRIYNKK